MKVSDQFPSRYLKVEDLNDEDMIVTIRDATSEVLGQGQDAQRKLIVHFRETEKGLACNKTNAGIIAKLYGDDTDFWIGKQIILWPNHDVAFKGEIVSAIRVRSKAPPQGQRRPASTAATGSANGVMSYAEACAAVENVGSSPDALKDYLRDHGINGWAPSTAAQCSELTRAFIASLDDIPF
jgi:F0F1-type ATP synthase alpha subunit